MMFVRFRGQSTNWGQPTSPLRYVPDSVPLISVKLMTSAESRCCCGLVLVRWQRFDIHVHSTVSCPDRKSDAMNTGCAWCRTRSEEPRACEPRPVANHRRLFYYNYVVNKTTNKHRHWFCLTVGLTFFTRTRLLYKHCYRVLLLSSSFISKLFH